MSTVRLTIFAVVLSAMLAGCLGTPPAPPAATAVDSGPSNTGYENYENYDCSRLAAELTTITGRESQLAAERAKTTMQSRMPVLWFQLASVRAEKKAVQDAMATKSCQTAKQ